MKLTLPFCSQFLGLLRRFYPVCLGALALLSFGASASGTTLSLGPTGDTRIMNGSGNDGTDTLLGVYQDRDRTLIKFDFSVLPTNAIIDGAELLLSPDSVYNNGGGDFIEVYRVTNDWTELGATWTSFDGTHAWANAGGDAVGTTTNRFADPFASINYQGADFNYINRWSWDVTTLVQDWVGGQFPNQGLMVKQNGTLGNLHFLSRENPSVTNRPQLLVTYHVDDDFTPPYITDVTLTNVTSGYAGLTYLIKFSEQVDPSTATDPSNFIFTNAGVVVTHVVYDALSQQTALTIKGILPNSDYSLAVSSVQDAAGNVLDGTNFIGNVGNYYIDWAIYGTASQSSTSNGGDASRAIDGNTDGVFNDLSVTHSGDPATETNRYWRVDLGAEKMIKRLSVWLRTDSSTAFRNTNFTMSIYDAATNQVWTGSYAGSPPTNVSFMIPGGVSGQYIVYTPGTPTNTAFSLAEVQAFNDWYDTVPPIITDMQVTNPPGSLQLKFTYSEPVQASLATLRANYSFADTNVIFASLKLNGQVVTINLLCPSNPPTAVSVSGVADLAGNYLQPTNFTLPSLGVTNNWALVGTATMSSTYNSTTKAANAIDGNTTGTYSSGSIALSAGGASDTNRFWRVDLGAARPIQEISVWARTDAGDVYETNFTVVVYDGATNQVWTGTYAGPAVAHVNFPIAGGVVGQYVKYLPGSPAGSQFGLAEMQVFDKYDFAPLITSQPHSTVRYQGTTATFSVTATAIADLGYQWRHAGTNLTEDGVGIVGAQSNVLMLGNISLNEAGNYSCLITNAYGSVTSSVAVLTVTLPGSPQIVWSAPRVITTADEMLSQTGTVVGAQVFGDNAQVVTLTNGASVSFVNAAFANGKSVGSVASVSGSGPYSGFFSGSTGNTGLDAILTQGNYDGGPKTITLKNLIPGHQYNVLLIGLDDRSTASARSAYFQDPTDSSDVSDTFTMGQNVYVMGQFAAQSTNQTIIEQLPTGNSGNMNALVVYELSTGTVAGNPGSIHLGYNNGSLQLTWTNSSTLLLSATNLLGPWITNTGVSSPYTVTNNAPKMFFRLQGL